MAFLPVLLLLLLSVTHRATSQDSEDSEALPRGCGWGLVRPYTLLCDLDSIWGVAVESVAAGGILTAIMLALVLLCRLHHIGEAEKRSAVGPILLLLLGVLGLFGLSFAYLIEQDESLCLLRRALWGLLFAVCFSCLLVQGVRLRRLGRERRSPGGCALTGLALGLSAVQGIIAAEWLLLTVLREGRAACQYLPMDFSLACSYVLALLLAALAAASLALCAKTRQWRCNAIWLLLTCLLSLLLWVAWVGFYLYGNDWLGRSPDWNDPALAIALVAQGWLLLIFHAIPESHICMRSPPQPNAPDYFDTSQNSTRMRETSFDEDIPLSHRQFVENQGYGYSDENAAGLRTGGGPVQHNSNTGARPSAPFRSNVYQPTEMTMILNGGAVSTSSQSQVPSAPPTYTGRQLW
ncbi:G protein-coupled receptor, class C, group 5, member Ba isoform X1 [Labrus bergylta]|uniref:G protein-coupled receptor, class C, group 5, member Ba isoform X1 n=1 Tax=Labrus bergylta TaxID=56723 RepID=UPI0009B41391|nr:G-protein coupled receptor family C group 5 member B isoform X1 [Labrus bergylta]XP_029133622.1 G-protein coupled receptor family C group 5 member B isoform X1 [Labrus bergylta]